MAEDEPQFHNRQYVRNGDNSVWKANFKSVLQALKSTWKERQ